jgi:thioredoxin reductase (NADPH)
MAKTNIRLYGTNWCSDCKKFLGKQRVHNEFINIEENAAGQTYVRERQQGGLTIPTIVFEDGSVLIEPSNAELAIKLGLETKAKCEFYDLVVSGGDLRGSRWLRRAGHRARWPRGGRPVLPSASITILVFPRE